ncbi:MAG: hypothetical protein ACREBU_21065 [Nitrososphaera sp.]
MRTGFVVVGIIVLVISVPIYIYDNNAMAQYNTSLGQLGRFFSPDARLAYQDLQTEIMIVVLIAIVGVITLAYGFVAKEPPRTNYA